MAESGANGSDQRPLEGIRVLDFTRVVAGPLATRMMADLGAEVIKIEPVDGDLCRTFPPYVPGGVNPYFCQQNAGKRFCSVDLRAPGASDLVRELVSHCDAVVENYRPGVMAKFGPRSQRALRGAPGARLLLGDRVRPDRSVGSSACLRARRSHRVGLHRVQHAQDSRRG